MEHQLGAKLCSAVSRTTGEHDGAINSGTRQSSGHAMWGVWALTSLAERMLQDSQIC